MCSVHYAETERPMRMGTNSETFLHFVQNHWEEKLKSNVGAQDFALAAKENLKHREKKGQIIYGNWSRVTEEQ